MDSDAIVVGAGPAGASAARALAAGGVRVRLLDRQRFPRNKPCAGGITMRALPRFPWLGPALPRITTHRVSRLLLEGPSGESVLLESPRPAVLLIRRCDFDDLLVRLAVEAGAELEEEAWVSSVKADEHGVAVRTRDGRSLAARFLVAADGVNGVTARGLGLWDGWDAGRLALDMMEETPDRTLRAVDPGTLWVSYGHGGTDGYGYIFPKRDHVNVGIGCLLTCFRQEIEQAPYEMHEAFVKHLLDRRALSGESSREHFTPSHVPVGGPISRTARGRVLVAGDAGGFVNAYTAEGIYYAMVSGELAGQAIAATLDAAGPAESQGAARRYVRAWKSEIGAELRDAVLIQKYLFRERRRIGGVIRGAGEHREVADLIVAYANGTVSYKAARRRILAKFPRVALRLGRIYLASLAAPQAGGPPPRRGEGPEPV